MTQPFRVQTESLARALAGVQALVLPVSAKGAGSLAEAVAPLPEELARAIIAYADRVKLKLEAKQSASFDVHEGQLRVVVTVLADDCTMFELLTAARKALEPALAAKPKAIAVETRLWRARAADLADAFVAAASAATWSFKKATGKKKDGAAPEDDAPPAAIELLCDDAQRSETEQRAQLAALLGDGTNLVRNLTRKAISELDCRAYIELVQETARTEGLHFHLTSQRDLDAMGAGAFLAVARGSAHQDAGIVRLSTRRDDAKKTDRKHLVLVGKGVMYDTGGVNLKPAEYMFGMEGDMMGSAVALALVVAAKRGQWPFDVTAFLAVAENAIGPHAYRPNEVVTSLKGTTIETVHTDAEGRMLLADTLHLAVQEKPALIVDFATLTGSCIRAIGTNYAGVFTNRPALRDTLESAGRVSGERVWMFPLDADYAECLESEVADIKQCRLRGGVDHIEAASFLRHFVGEETPWVHVDLSPGAHTGGLGHVSGDVNGFGVRFGARFILDQMAKA